MREIYGAAFLATFLVLLFCIIKAGKSTKKIRTTVRCTLMVAEVSVLANSITVLSQNLTVCLIAYSVFFASIGWLLFCVLRFVKEYTGIHSHWKTVQMILGGVLTIDSISLLLNTWLGHAFACKSHPFEDGIYYYVAGKIPYNIHLLISYLLVLIIFYYLIRQIVLTPKMYRSKYVRVFISLLVVVVGDAVYVVTDTMVDVSVYIFLAAGFLVYYYSMIYEPKELVEQEMILAVHEMADGVMLYDMDGESIIVNETAQRLLLSLGKKTVCPLAEMLAAFDISGEPGECKDVEKSWSRDEIHLKIQFRSMTDEKGKYLGAFLIFQDRTAEVNKLQKERYAARHDALTGIYNKEYFSERVKKKLKEEPDGAYVMVCSDVKDFKIINDVFGMQSGDELLIRIAEHLREKIHEGTLYGRLDSDHFAVMIKKEQYSDEIFLQAVDEVIHLDSVIRFPVKIYVGVYEIKDRDIPVSVMCDRAFMAARTIREDYKSGVAFYDEKLRQSVLWEQELTADLDGALENGEIQMFLQPQVDVNGKILGAEALVRWQHPKYGMIPPTDFIPVFEKSGLVARIDRYIWEQACIQLQKWKEKGVDDLSISVNISPRDFYFMDLYPIFTGLVTTYGINPANLKLEITETAVMQNLEKQLALIGCLQKYGFTVEMDDFGSGYSSLNMLKDMQVDVLKIDMAFLGETKDVERSRKILRMIIELSKQLGMRVVTEGVETKEQVAFLTEMGCDIFQGYFFARPMPVAQFEQSWMEKRK